MASGILGSKTGDFLTWVTIALVSVFLTLAVVMARYYKPSIGDFGEGTPPPTTVPTGPPRTPEPTSPIGETGTPLGGENADANSPGIR
jgi:hypothetical protein